MRPNVRSVCSVVGRGDVAAGQIGVLARQRRAHVADRHPVGGQAVGVDPDVDRPLEAADDRHLPDPARALERALDHLVGDLGQLAQGAFPETAIVSTGAASLSIFAISGGSVSSGRSLQDRGDPIAHILRHRVDVATELEGGQDLRYTPRR